MTNEELADARIFALASPVILPLIQRRKQNAFMKLVARHKEGITDNTAIIAELSVLNDLEIELNQKEQIYRHAEESQNARTKRI